MLPPLATTFSHNGANPEGELRTKATYRSQYRHHDPPKQAICRVTLAPFRQLHIRLLEGENPSTSVPRCLFGHRPINTLSDWRRGASEKSAESTHQFVRVGAVVGCSLGKGLVSPTWKNGFPRIVIPFPSLHQPICKRKMNACWDRQTRHVCARIITHATLRTLQLN